MTGRKVVGQNVVTSLSRSGSPSTGWRVVDRAVSIGKLNLTFVKSEPVLKRLIDARASSEQGLYLVLYASSAGGL